MKSILKFPLKIIAIIYLYVRPIFERVVGELQLSKIKHRGKNCKFDGYGIIIDASNLFLGDEVSIGRNFFIRATGCVSIGSYTHISRNVTIHTVNHNVKGNLLPYDLDEISSPISIGKFVWIGMNSSILSGVTIGDGAIIGMNSTITKDVQPGQIVVGSSQRCVGARDFEHTKILLDKQAFLKNKRY
jgi:acetyltransferase-like isoleucine patch superfamily enzyme